MSETSPPVINIAKLEQVGMVVHDVDKAMKDMWNNFGIGPWGINIRDSNTMTDMMYHGKPANFSFKAARAPNKLGGVEIELIEPLEGENIYSDFLREHGEGVHHLGWHVVPTFEAFKEILKLDKVGFPCLMSGRTPTSNFAYIDTMKTMGTILEVIWWDPASTATGPMYVFPEGAEL